MTDEPQTFYENDFFRWFKTQLKDKGLQFSRCGFKMDGLGSRHDIDLTTGFWKEPSYSSNKPPRWLYQIRQDDTGWKAINPAEGAHILGAINASQKDKAGVVFRIRILAILFRGFCDLGRAILYLPRCYKNTIAEDFSYDKNEEEFLTD